MRFSHLALILLLVVVSTTGVKALNQSPLVGQTTLNNGLPDTVTTLVKTHLKTQLTIPRRLADVDVTLPRPTGSRPLNPKTRQVLTTLANPLIRQALSADPSTDLQATAHAVPKPVNRVDTLPLDAKTRQTLDALAKPQISHALSGNAPAKTQVSQTPDLKPANPTATKPMDAKTRETLAALNSPLAGNAFLAVGPACESTKPESQKSTHPLATPKMPLTAAQALEADRQDIKHQAERRTACSTETPVQAQPPKTPTPRKLPNGLFSAVRQLHPANNLRLPRLTLNQGQIIRLNQQASSGINMLNFAGSPITVSPYIALRAPSPMVLRSGITNDKSLELVVGKSRVINLPFPVARVAVSNPGVAQALVISPTQLQLVGKQPGLTNLTLWNSPNDSNPLTYDLNVLRDVSQLAKQLKRIDPNISISALAADNAVILTGEVEAPEVAQLAVQIASAYFNATSQATNTPAQSSGGAPSGGASGASSSGSASSASSGQGANGQTSGNSMAPGSSIPVSSRPNVVNMLKIKGRPSSKMALVRDKLHAIDPAIDMDLVPGPNNTEKVILTGKVKSASIVSRAINTASIFYGEPGLKVITGPGGNAIKSTSDANFQSDAAFSNNLDVNILQGSVVTDTSGNVVSMMQVTEKPQIRCSIKILDISRRDLNQLGATFSGGTRNFNAASLSGAQGTNRSFMDINSEQSGNSLTGSRGSGGVANNGLNAVTQTYRNGLTQVFSINQSLNMALSAFIEKRNIKTLAEPTMTMLSGEKASFLAGGEIPVPVSAMNGQISVEFKEFGIRLNLIPTLTENGKIHMQIAPEVSEVDPTITISTNNINIPGFRKRRMQTTLELDNKQAFVLAGLFNKSSLDVLSKFPGMGNLPVVGALFRQKNGERSDNEMVVIIQPEVITSTNGTEP